MSTSVTDYLPILCGGSPTRKLIIKTREQQRFLQLTSGVWAAASIGVAYALGIISNEMKTRFDLTQADLTTISTIGFVCGMFSLPAGFTWDRWGPRPVLCTAAVFLGASFIFLALSFKHVIPTNVGLLSIYYALTAMGTSWADVGSLMTNMYMFPQNQGDVVMLQKTWNGLGSTVFAISYIGWFDHDVGAYCIYVACLCISANLVAAYLVELPVDKMIQRKEQRLLAAEESRGASSRNEASSDVGKKVLGLNQAFTAAMLPTISEEELEEAEEQRQYLDTVPADPRRLRCGFALLVFFIAYLTTVTCVNAYVSVNSGVSSFLAVVTLLILIVGFLSMPLAPFRMRPEEAFAVHVHGGGFGTNNSDLSYGGINGAEGGGVKVAGGSLDAGPRGSRSASSFGGSVADTNDGDDKSMQQFGVPAVVVRGSTFGAQLGVDHINSSTKKSRKKHKRVPGTTTHHSSRGIEADTSGGDDTAASGPPQYQTPFLKSLRKPDIWLMWWSSFCLWGSGVTISVNSAQIYRAKNNDEFVSATNALYVAMVGVGGALGRITVGLLEQKLVRARGKPLTWLYFPAAILQTIGCLLFVILPSNLLILPFVVFCAGYGWSWGASVLLIPQLFAKDSGKHYNFLFSAGMISVILLNRGVFGTIFSHEGEVQGRGIHCAGTVCILVPMIVMAVLNVTAVFSCFLVHVRWIRFLNNTVAATYLDGDSDSEDEKGPTTSLGNGISISRVEHSA